MSFLLVANILVLSVLMGSACGAQAYTLYYQPGMTVTSPPVSLQAGTAGSSTIYANNTSAKVITVAPAPPPTYYPSGYSTTSGNWWNSSYTYRKRIVINNNVAPALSTGYSVLLTLDTSSLVSTGKMLSSGDDLRILYWNSSSASWYQLNRDVENINTASTKIWFKTQASIAGSGADGSYYVYYGCSSPGSPPANKDNVYVFWDGFESGNLNKWAVQSGAWTVATDQKFSGTYSLKHGTTSSVYWMKPSASISEKDVLVESYWRSADVLLDFAQCARVQSGASKNWYETNVEASSGWDIAKYVNDVWAEVIPNGGSFSGGVWYKVTFIVLGSTGAKVLVNGTQVTPSSGWSDIGTDFTAPGTIAVRTGIINTAAWVDNVKVRKYVDPEPSASVSPEESRYLVSGTVPASVQSVDSNYFVVNSAGSATSTTAYSASSYNLVGSTTLVSGTVGDLSSNNGVYMMFRSYASATSAQTLYSHNENASIAGTTYRLKKLISSDASGTTTSADAGTTGRKLMGKFVYQLTGVSTIPASTWTVYYRAYKGHVNIDATADVDILVRMSNGTVRSTIATQVAVSGALTTSWSTLSGTYSWTAYTVLAQTDFLEIDCYITVTTGKSGNSVYSRIDDNTLALVDQSRVGNVVLPSAFTTEVEFTGSSNTQPWFQLVWSLDSAWTTGAASVTIQVYNYTGAGGYPLSGDGFRSYASNSTANNDDTIMQTIITNPTHFRNGTGYWKIKLKGVKTTTSQFDFKADWVKFEPSYYNQYSVSNEFILASMTTNMPMQLNFTVVSEYNIAAVSVTIQVWNYSSSPQAYVTVGEGYMTYVSSGTNETKLLSINTNPQFYTSGGNAKIRLAGVLTTTTQYQQKTNQVKLVYKYNSSSNYNYVLRIVDQVSDAWKIRLAAYSDANRGRLNNCTIYFRNSSDGTSRQIYIQNGAYVTQTGPWYDLPTSPAERYIAVTLDASVAGESYVYVYLEILVPNKTTYAKYILAFKIT